jgi:two-component system LytT family response regulator
MPQLELLACAGDGHSALQAIRQHQPALVLMDIQMPGLTGLQVLRALGEDGQASARRLPAVIFTTAYDEHALTAFELHAVDYLLKPFAHDRFVEAIGHALQDSAEDDTAAVRSLPALEAAAAGGSAPLQRVLVRDMGRIVPLQVEAIEYLRSDTKYTALSSRGRQYLVRLPILHFETRLDAARFLKISRSCIVNLDFVESMSPDENSQFIVKMRDGTLLTANREVSRQLRASSL